ncbi:hypothetical protein SCULI_v1c08430 [Spiroplasma culicicola AES-1]|uniref:Uncharacterized protein n=1 Tax=Spiroplasma culicicola AES-1 TaxID=1276246 RepID=W6A7S0_9MOLU|nr:hypothetical protein SCULI_v1c08430 [Spiroplasma culicicola AES-1]
MLKVWLFSKIYIITNVSYIGRLYTKTRGKKLWYF